MSYHWFLCTWNNYPEDGWLQLQSKLAPQYILGQKEVGAETGTPHYQFVLWFENSTRVGALHKKLKGPRYEGKPGGAASDLIIYVQKEETRVTDSKFEFGKQPKIKSPKSESLVRRFEETLEFVKSGDLKKILPQHQVQYWGNLSKLLAYYSQSVDQTAVRGIWIYGVPGSGKSYAARKMSGGTWYSKMQNKWWDGYAGEQSVILDDFDKQGFCLSHHLKIWLDMYSFVGEIKGGSLRPNYARFIITSNYKPEEIWPEDPSLVAAISRRCKFIHQLGWI